MLCDALYLILVLKKKLIHKWCLWIEVDNIWDKVECCSTQGGREVAFSRLVPAQFPHKTCGSCPFLIPVVTRVSDYLKACSFSLLIT